MSSSLPIGPGSNITAPTPQNTPLQHAPLSSGLSRPTVPDITEDKEEEDEEDTDANPLHNAMLGMVQGRLADLVGRSSGYIERLPVEVKRSVEALKGVQIKQNELQNKFKRECLELEKKVLSLSLSWTSRCSPFLASTLSCPSLCTSVESLSSKAI